MSWKSLVTAGLLCVLASPVFAAPTMNIVKGGTVNNGNLDANGNWVWNVQISPDLALMPAGDTSGTPVAAELGFTSSSNVLSATRNATNFDTLNPGSVIFSSWQTAANGLLDANSNNRPTGVQLNAPGVGTNAGASYTANSSVSGTANQVFASLGSVVFTTAGAKDFMQLVVAGPVDPGNTPANAAASTTITVGGVYGTGSTNGRISQINGGTSGGPYTTGNFDTFSGAFTRSVARGDVNMDGTAKDEDLAVILSNFNATGRHWNTGDLNGDGITKDEDLALLLSNFNGTGGSGLSAGGGGGLSSGGSVPEPASLALVGLAILGGLGVIGRKR